MENELKKQELVKEFQEASQDEERNAEIEIWDNLSRSGLNEWKTTKHSSFYQQ